MHIWLLLIDTVLCLPHLADSSLVTSWASRVARKCAVTWFLRLNMSLAATDFGTYDKQAHCPFYSTAAADIVFWSSITCCASCVTLIHTDSQKNRMVGTLLWYHIKRKVWTNTRKLPIEPCQKLSLWISIFIVVVVIFVCKFQMCWYFIEIPSCKYLQAKLYCAVNNIVGAKIFAAN
jgi:hypothetical protein